MLPLNPIKEILKQECNPHQISMEAVIESRNFLQELMRKLSKNAEEELAQLNKRRKKLGLPRLKRLNAWAVKKAEEKVFNNTNNNDTGSPSRRIRSLGGKMLASMKPTKSAKDDRAEVTQ